MSASPDFGISLVVLVMVFAVGAMFAAAFRWKGVGPGLIILSALLIVIGVVVSYWTMSVEDRPVTRSVAVAQPLSSDGFSVARESTLPTAAELENGATVLDFRGDDASDKTGEIPVKDAKDKKPSGKSEVQPSIVEFNGGESVGRSLKELPSWVSEPTRFEEDRDRAWVVLASGQFATIEEAEDDLYKQAVPELMTYLTREYPSMAGWQPSRELVRNSGVIARRVHQKRVLEVGEFEEPIHRVYWMLELRPGDREEFFAAWRPEAVRHRLTVLGSIFGGLTLLLGGIAVVSRREPRSRKQDRPEQTAVA
ncbi:hypothetical protein Mal4_49330 [Maioricimonas rarisocia]|uniref:Uncharacterized protein n=1 Tax=Maioricimonas rarisocia TaxID=2528026 RepID=A0A517ZDM7_9PLAN|nr:hypothetical protein [Maioricimonas rarisocia]QDU40575.1 hypothetical protein Mal4_49330 [Maioricimonas rarisocia]